MFRVSRFQALMKGLSRSQFDAAVARHGGDRYSKGFGCWDLLTAMVFGQLSDASSLRQLEAGFNAQSAQHYHLGTRAVRRSTLADASAKRSPAVFEEVARQLMAQVGRGLRKQGQELLYLLDSTSITLKGRGFDAWTGDNATRNTQGLKLHVLFDAATQAPIQQSITAANINDLNEGRTLPLQAGATYVFDKGYCDYNWWASFDRNKAFFVTRFKSNARLGVVQTRPVPEEDRAVVLADELVEFTNKAPGGGRRNTYTRPLRRITVAREGDKPLVLATNDLERPAGQIARRYKDRWQIELFFKWLKQHLRITQFLGRSENAVRIQILCALITHLLLALYRKASGSRASLWDLMGTLKVALFQRPEVERAVAERRRRHQQELQARQAGLFA